MRPMSSFNDFCKWAGSQRRAAEMLGVSEASVSRWAARGRVPHVMAAKRAEEVSHGLFHWPQMMEAPPSDQQEAA